MNPFIPDKILCHPDRIAEWLEGGDTRPISWELDLTNACDQKCPDCPGGRNNNQSLDLDTAENYVYQIKALGGKSIVLTGGGEPLLNSIITKVVKYIHYSKGMDVSLITNGTQLNKDNVFDIVENCTWVRVSLDAGSPEIYKFTHGCNKKTFKSVLGGISLLVEAKKAKLPEGYNCTIGVAFLTHNKTRKDMLVFTKLCQWLGVDYVQFRPYHYNFCDVTEELKECEKQTIPGQFYVLKSGNKYDHLTERQPYDICYGHHFCGVINVHNVYLCCHFRGMDKYKLGDLRENKLYEIWESEQRKKIYQNIDYSDCYPVCRCDRLNRILWKLKEEPATHINFV